MQNIYLSVIIPILMAFCYRARGGAIPLGSTTLARLVFYIAPITLVMAYVAGQHHMPWWIIAVSALASFGGICIGHSMYQGNTWIDFMDMAGIIAVRLAMIFMPFAAWDIHFLLPISFAALTLPACWLGWHMRVNMGRWCVQGDSSWEEWFIGMMPIGGALVCALWI